jgi:hypothetical protein
MFWGVALATAIVAMSGSAVAGVVTFVVVGIGSVIDAAYEPE